MPKSKYLASLTEEKRSDLRRRLWERQGQVCFICEGEIDLHLHDGDLDIDHIDPLAADGLDAENNFALTHASCNRSKGASNLEIARRMSKFERLQEEARKGGKRGANLGDLLTTYGGSTESLRLSRELSSVRFTLSAAGDIAVRSVPVHHDGLSGMDSFFTELPIEYLHHDDKINPRTIGSNLRGLIEEFQKDVRNCMRRWPGGRRSLREATLAKYKSSTDSTRRPRRFCSVPARCLCECS